MTENKKYLKIFKKALEKIKRYMFASGSVKSDEFIGSFHQLYVKDEIDFKPLGCYPLPSAGFEYCSTTELVVDYQLATSILGDSAYSEMQENALLNAAMAARRADGKSIQYISCENMYDASVAVGTRYDYSPTHADAAVCCAPNACRIMPIHTDSIFLSTKEGFLVNMFAPAGIHTSIKNKKVHLYQDTNYPFSKEVNITIKTEESTAFSVDIRIPECAHNPVFFIDGKLVATTVVDGIVSLANFWTDNIISIQFDFIPKLIYAPDSTAAVFYGPLMYSLKIEEEEERYFQYENAKDFYDINFTPKKHSDWNYTFILDEKKNLRYYKEIPYKDGYGWQLPMQLEVLMLDRFSIPQKVALKPIGSTTLRRSTFPVIVDERKRYVFASLSEQQSKFTQQKED